MPLTPEQVQAYDRAAVALERHVATRNIEPPAARNIARAAYIRAEKAARVSESTEDINNRAARLLRECIEKGEPLP